MSRSRRTPSVILVLLILVIACALLLIAPVRRSIWAGVRGPFCAWSRFRQQVSTYEAWAGRAQELEIARALAEEATGEQERLSQLGAVAVQIQGMGMEVVAARVVGLESRDNRRRLYVGLDRGARISDRDFAMAPWGVVGRVISTSGESCEVALLSDPLMGVGVQVGTVAEGASGRSPALGVVVGGQGPGLLSLQYLPSDALVLEGDRVTTSGAGAIFPPGLPVGRVVGYPVQAGPVKPIRADVRPFAQWRRLREVLIVRNPRPAAVEEAPGDQ